jgi:sporulation protein YlmC with PRC-barrel domain
MKPTSILITAALMASSFCLPAQGADNPNALKYRRTEKFAELVGSEVWNLQNEKLGKVKFVTADVENGRLVEVVVTSGGGFFGMGAKYTAVAPRALTFDEAGQMLRLNVSRARFAAAPKFDSSHMAAATACERVAAVNRYFGLEPWFYVHGQTVVKNAQILPLGHIQKLSDIIGLSVSSAKRGYMGEVGSLITDLPKGQLVHVIATRNTMGKADNVVIQSRALKYNARHTALVVDDNYKQLAGEPSFKWLSNGSFQEESYVNREVQADGGLHSKQNVQEGKVHNATAMQQGPDFRDQQKTARINQSIQADPSLSSNAKHIEVVTLHAQTTLRGHVNTAEGKIRVGEIAAKLGRPEDVSNLLEIRPLR